MLFIEDLARLMLWLLATIVLLNVVFACFILFRRAGFKQYYAVKDAAREQARPSVAAFADGRIPLEETAVALSSQTSKPAREAVHELLLAAATPENQVRISELLFMLKSVHRWACQAFGRRRAGHLEALSIARRPLDRPPHRGVAILRPFRRLKALSVPRALAVDQLGRLAPEFNDVFLVEALGDPANEVRRIAVNRLASTRRPAVVPTLMEELRRLVADDNDLSWRSLKAALAMYRVADLDRFLPFVADEKPRMRFCVADIIREICEQESKTILLNKNDFSPAFYSAFLERAMRDPSPDVRARAVTVVRHFRDGRARDVLRHLLSDENEFVRLHTVRACGDPYYGDLIPDVVGRLQDVSWRVQDAAARVLLTFGSSGNNELYRALLEATDEDTGEQISDVIHRAGLLPQLLLALGDGGGDGDLADAVCRKLVLMGKSAYMVYAVASQPDEAICARLMDILMAAPTREYVAVLEGLASTDGGPIGVEASRHLQVLQAGLPVGA